MPVISMEERDQKAPVWDMSQERVLIYTLLNQRLQFFLVFFSVVVAGAINASSQARMQIILIFGAVISWLLGIVIVRTQSRLTEVLNILSRDSTHPYTIVTLQTNQKNRIQPLVSYSIPVICATLLTITGVLSVFEVLVF